MTRDSTLSVYDQTYRYYLERLKQRPFPGCPCCWFSMTLMRIFRLPPRCFSSGAPTPFWMPKARPSWATL